MGKEWLQKRVEGCWDTASYAMDEMQKHGIQCWKNKNAITVVFPPQPEEITQKWQLATEESMTHVICMPNVTKEQIDALILDIADHGNKYFPVD
jgi:histidine decarboxylase